MYKVCCAHFARALPYNYNQKQIHDIVDGLIKRIQCNALHTNAQGSTAINQQTDGKSPQMEHISNRNKLLYL